MIAGHEASERHGERRAVTQHSRPRLGIFVGQNRSHRPGKHGVSAGKGSVDGVMLEKVSVAVAFARALTAENKLHGRIEEESIDQSFEFQFSGLAGVLMFGLDAVKPNAAERSR